MKYQPVSGREMVVLSFSLCPIWTETCYETFYVEDLRCTIHPRNFQSVVLTESPTMSINVNI